MEAAIEAMQAAFRDAFAGHVLCPPRTVLEQSIGEARARSMLLTMPAAWSGHGFGAKVSTFIGDNAAHGRPAVQGIAALLDVETGAPALLVDAAALTTRRTAAMVGLATRELADPEAESLGIIGTGALAAEMIEAVRTVRPLRRVWLYNRNADKARRLAASLQEISLQGISSQGISSQGISAEVLDSADAVARRSRILVLATSSTDPVVSDTALLPGTHVNAVGNFSPRGREVEGPTVGRSEVWVDTWEGCESEAGEILLAAQEGFIAPGREGVQGELARLVSVPHRPTGADLTLFKSVGTAIADIAGMAAAREGAERLGIGTVLSAS